MINELLRKRILGLTGDAATLPPESMQQAEMLKALQEGKGAFSNKDMEIIAGLSPQAGNAMPQGPRLVDGSPLPAGMVPGITRTMEYRDYNQNGIEDRDEGIYLPRDLVPESSIPQMTEAQKEYQKRFFVTPPSGGLRNMDPEFGRDFSRAMPTDKDPIDEMDEETRQELQDLLGKAGS